jgi:hypothetical protein
MNQCPLLQKPCIENECAWWAGGIKKCSIIAIAMMMEHIHDFSILAFNKLAPSDTVEPEVPTRT